MFFNSFGTNGTLAVWSVVVLMQSVSMYNVSCSGPSLIRYDPPQVHDGNQYCEWRDEYTRHKGFNLVTFTVDFVFSPNLRLRTGRWSSWLTLAVPHKCLHEDTGELCLGCGTLLFSPRAFGICRIERDQCHF